MDAIWIVVIVIVALVVLGALAVAGRRRSEQVRGEKREEAQGVRDEARVAARNAEQARLQAEEQAERARSEGEAARELEREAARIDPDVDDVEREVQQLVELRRPDGQRERVRPPGEAAGVEVAQPHHLDVIVAEVWRKGELGDLAEADDAQSDRPTGDRQRRHHAAKCCSRSTRSPRSAGGDEDESGQRQRQPARLPATDPLP